MTKKPRFISLWLRSLILLVISVAVAAAAFVTVRELGDFMVWRYYLEESTKQEREQKHIERLQDYVTTRMITSSETDRVISWADGKYVDVVIYQNSDLIYSPEWFKNFDPEIPDSFKENEFFESWFSGDRGFEQYLTEEARRKYADTLDTILEGNQAIHPLYCVDGTLLVSFVDYTDEVAYNIVLAAAVMAAIAVVAVVMIINLGSMARRVNKLAQDVRLIEGGDLDAPISIKGNDDITSLAHDVDSMRTALIENMTKEREAWESNSALITAMSHDIRTPLTVLMGYLDLIELSDADDANAEYLAVCRENAERLKKLSDDMFSYFLVFGKKDMGLDMQSVSLSNEVSGMIAEHRFLLEEKGYRFADTAELPEACVNIDLVYFSRVIDNIFSNIAKYADREREIVIRSECDAERVEISFENAIRKDKSIPESNRIGIKTCGKILSEMGGALEIHENEDSFVITVKLDMEK